MTQDGARIPVPVDALEVLALQSVDLCKRVIAHCDEVDALLEAAGRMPAAPAPKDLPDNVVWLADRRARGARADASPGRIAP